MTTSDAPPPDQIDGSVASRALARLSDRLAAADPAHSRLRLGARALLSMLTTAAVLALMAQVFTMPIICYGLALMLTFNGAFGVRDSGWRAQGMTRLLSGLVAIVIALISGSLSTMPLISDLVFLAVIFGSVYLRRFGQRGLSIGLTAFFSYFIASYLHATPADAGWIVYACVLGMGVTQIITAGLLPDDAEQDFRRAIRAIDHRINLILSDLLDEALSGGARPEDTRRMRHHSARLRDIVLMAEGFIPQTNGPTWASSGPAVDLATALFDLQLAGERLIGNRFVALPSAAALRALLTERGPYLQGDDAAPQAASGRARVPNPLLDRLRTARAQINSHLRVTPSPAFAAAETPVPANGSPSPPPRKAARRRVPESLYRPIQITFATGLALGAGWMISSSRWYWAVITAYLVFNNTKTRADTAIRALHRAAGTLGGVLAGTLLATLLQGHVIASSVLLVPLIFISVFFLQTSYGMMIFFLTIALALLYGLLGTFTPELLLLRLEETLIGGIAGVGTAFLVFPVRTAPGVKSALEDYFTALRAIVVAAREPKGADLLALSRRLDRCYSDLAATVRPLGGPWSAVTRFGQIREKLLLLVTITRWSRILSRAMPDISDTEQAQVITLSHEVEARIAVAMSASARWFDDVRNPAMPPMVGRVDTASVEDDSPRVALESMLRFLDHALDRRGLPHRLQDAALTS